MKKLLLSICTAAVLYFASTPAHATTGYVCSVDQYNYAPFGSNGGIAAALYTGAACTGTFLGYGYLCTLNSTANVCSANSYRFYSEAQLMGQFSSLLDAARQSKKVGFGFSTSCKSGGTSCIDGITFYGN